MERSTKGEVEMLQTFELSDGSRSVTILATKEEEQRINKDQEYATRRFLSAVGEGSGSGADEAEDDFNHNATLLLIECLRDRFHKFCSTRQERNQVYKEVQEELRLYSYNLSVEKIRSKWNNLVTTYKRIKDRHKAGSAGRRVWDYFQPIDELLGPTMESGGGANVSVMTVKPHSITNTFQHPKPMPAHTVIIKTSTSPGPSQTTFSGPSHVSMSPVSSGTTCLPASNCIVREVKRKDSETEDTNEQVDRTERRHDIIEQYLQQLKDTQEKEEMYKRRKERRERMKLKALQNIGRELESISKIQIEILRKQDLLHEAISQRKVSKR
ncbi:hypothetical protein Pcinc_000849 [Petrolisthes cinctipes]|uniref:MADF domain-containing protein n=1 Tax=Petrolisthes cinctipes TaxID=88211 RepID=A0AAE1GL72_PETCI|nr:hypothetical protein Pcinc_000849 [Petrolisthes cinctipes]